MKEVIMKVPSFSADYPKAPIYVADLVRCKECKYGDTGTDEDGNLFWKCLGGHYGGTNPDDFCSYGEREGE